VKKNWLIEYEIPPLRAIYHAQMSEATEDEVRAQCAAQSPPWTVRKLTVICPDCDGTGIIYGAGGIGENKWTCKNCNGTGRL
jgi:DnaJ-class molecular chaperone